MEKEHCDCFRSLPLELIEVICDHCDDNSLFDHLPRVAKVFWRILSQDNFWKRRSDTRKIRFIEHSTQSTKYNYRKNLQYYPDVQWSDIICQEHVKNSLRENITVSIKFPTTSATKQPKPGILLYGPLGAEKPMLAKAFASEAKIPFFYLSCCDLHSMWIGDSEGKVKNIFALAKKFTPAIIYLEDIDLIDGHPDGESESGRRVLTEFLVQFIARSDDLYVIAATDTPWNLVPSVQRRFEQRLWVGLPDLGRRVKLLKQHLETLPHDLTAEDLNQIGITTTGYSSNDISLLVREASMTSVKQFSAATHFKFIDVIKLIGGKEEVVEYLTPCSSEDPEAWPMKLSEVPSKKLLMPDITKKHFEVALMAVKPSLSIEDLAKFDAFGAVVRF